MRFHDSLNSRPEHTAHGYPLGFATAMKHLKQQQKVSLARGSGGSSTSLEALWIWA